MRLLCCVLCGTRVFLAEQMQKMLRRPCPNMMRCSTKGLTGRLPFAICIPGMAQVTRFYQHVTTINRNLGEQEKPTETNRVAIRIWANLHPIAMSWDTDILQFLQAPFSTLRHSLCSLNPVIHMSDLCTPSAGRWNQGIRQSMVVGLFRGPKSITSEMKLTPPVGQRHPLSMICLKNVNPTAAGHTHPKESSTQHSKQLCNIRA